MEIASKFVMSDVFNASVRDFEILPELRCSPYIYLIVCGVKQSITVRDYLTAICDEHHSYPGIRSIHQDLLAARAPAHSRFVVELKSSVRSAIVVKLTDRWLVPPAGFPKFFSQPSKDSLPSSPNRGVWPFHSEVSKAHFSNLSAKWTRLGPSVRHNPISTSPIVKPVNGL